MFKRKLKALDYIDWDKVNANDPQHFRKLVVWLEDQKIRHYKIEDRKDLRDMISKNWEETFKKYCDDVACPLNTEPIDKLEWLIGFAVKLEFEDNCKTHFVNYVQYETVTSYIIKQDLTTKKILFFITKVIVAILKKDDVTVAIPCPYISLFNKNAPTITDKKYQSITGSSIKDMKKSSAPSIKSSNPLDNLDFTSKEFKTGVEAISKLLGVPRHSDHLTTLEGCSKLVCKRLNSDALLNPSLVVVKGKEYPILEAELGFSMGDNVLNNAAKVLRLLYIQDLRTLQTQINEAVVAVQNITANPKTDTKLGQVGF